MISVLDHLGALTGTMLSVLDWTAISFAASVALTVVILGLVELDHRLIAENSHVVPAVVAISAASLAGAANDLVSTTTERLAIAVWLGLLGLFGSLILGEHNRVRLSH
jgi:hypothetical protein